MKQSGKKSLKLDQTFNDLKVFRPVLEERPAEPLFDPSTITMDLGFNDAEELEIQATPKDSVKRLILDKEDND